MIENVLKGSGDSRFSEFELLRYCNHNLIVDRLIIDLILYILYNKSVLERFLSYVPNHCFTNRLYSNIQETYNMTNEEIQKLNDRVSHNNSKYIRTFRG